MPYDTPHFPFGVPPSLPAFSALSVRKRVLQTVGYLAIRLVRALLLPFGLERASAFMGWCWQVIAPRTKRHPRALSQLEAAMPELNSEQRQTIARAMWNNLGRTFAEGLLLDRLQAEPQRISVEDETIVDRIWGQDDPERGAILASMHSANWEVFGVPIAERGYHVAGLYQAVQNPLIENYLLGQRQQLFRAGMISKGSHAMKRIVRLLRSGDAVAMLVDQRQAGRGVAVPFFGHDAPSTPLPATLALRTGARLVLGRCKRVGPVRFSIELKELDVAATGDHEADVARITSAIHAQFEAWIRERPHEWMWAHRRWSREVLRPKRG